MTAQKISRLIQPHNLTSFLIMLFALLVLAFGLGAGAAQSRQDGAAESVSDEREFKNTVRAHVPIKVKLKNEQSFKKKENKNWARELEVEIKNTGAKPIYYLYVGLLMPDVIAMGYPLSLGVSYGRKELAFFETPLEPGDVPSLPGESCTLKFPENQVRGYEKWRDKENIADPKKVEFYMQIINYGGGTGFEATEGLPVSGRTRKHSRHAPPPGPPPGGSKPAPKTGDTDLSGKLLNSFYPSTPASFLRVNFSPTETASVMSPAAQITGGCNDCQTNTSGACMWGTRGFTDCACSFPAVLSSNSCGDPSGSCLRVRTVTRPCDTEHNGTVFCQFQEFVGTCAVGDPTPTPSPSPSASPSPGCSPSSPQPAACCTPELVTFPGTSSGSTCNWNCNPPHCPTGTVFANGCISMGGPVVCDDPYVFTIFGPSGADCCPPTPTPTPTPTADLSAMPREPRPNPKS